MPLYQHYFPTDREQSFGEEWGESWGEVGVRVRERIRKELLRKDGAMRVESYSIESYKVESGTTKKRASKISIRSSLKLKKAATYSPALHCSTIGADGLNFSVRNGKRWNPDAITT